MGTVTRTRAGVAMAAVAGALLVGGCATHVAGDPTSGGSTGPTDGGITDYIPGTLAPTGTPSSTAPGGRLPTQLPSQLSPQPPTPPPTAPPTQPPTQPPTAPPSQPSGDPGATLASTVKSAKIVDSKPYQMPGDPTSVGFTSPSGNITCMVFATDDGGEEAQCDIATHTFTPPEHDCHGAGVWGRRVQLVVGQAPRFVCAGDYLGQWPALGYGEALTQGSVTCASEKDGVVCVDAVTGNGFRLARASYVFQPDASAGASGTPMSDFAGTWDQHGGQIVLSSSGAGDYRYRTYATCDSAPAPCDRVTDKGIVAGGHLTLTLSSAKPVADGTVAAGSVTASNDPDRAAKGLAVTATISDGCLSIPAISDVPFWRSDDLSGHCAS